METFFNKIQKVIITNIYFFTMLYIPRFGGYSGYGGRIPGFLVVTLVEANRVKLGSRWLRNGISDVDRQKTDYLKAGNVNTNSNILALEGAASDADGVSWMIGGEQAGRRIFFEFRDSRVLTGTVTVLVLTGQTILERRKNASEWTEDAKETGF